jgi:glycosyltransferase involved in cell wall biosynthesis
MIRTWRPDIVTAHGGESFKCAIFGAARRPVPIVYRRIGAVFPWIRTAPRRAAHGLMIRKASRIVAVGEAIREETIRVFHASPARVVSIPNAVDASRLRSTTTREVMRSVLGIPLSAPVVLSLGALSWEKDPLGHIDVVRRVARSLPGIVYMIAGEGPLRAESEAAVRRLGLVHKVHFLGSRSDVGDLLAAADVLLLASKTEGMPGCVIEAGMASVPVVSYAVGGIPEVVAHGVTGMLARGGDADALVNGLVRLLGDRDQRHLMGAAARERCLDRFDIGPVATKWLSVYEEVLDQG